MKRMPIALLLLTLAACGNPSPSPSASGAAPATAGTATPAASPGGATAAPSFALPSFVIPSLPIGSFPIPSVTGESGGSFTLKVEGGSLAGTYTASEAVGGCFETADQLQLALRGQGVGPSGRDMLVTVNANSDKALAGTAEFLMSVAFGEVTAGGVVAAYPSSAGNDGNLTAVDRGESITFTATGSAFGIKSDGSTEQMLLTLEAECTTIGST